MRRRTGRSVCLIRVVEMADRFPCSRDFGWLSGRQRGQQPHSATPSNVPTMSALSFPSLASVYGHGLTAHKVGQVIILNVYGVWLHSCGHAGTDHPRHRPRSRRGAFLLLALFAEMEHSFTAERAAPARAVAEAKDRRIGRPLARPRQLREHVAGRFAVTAGDRVPGELARAGAPSRRPGTPSLHVSSWRRATGRCRGETPRPGVREHCWPGWR